MKEKAVKYDYIVCATMVMLCCRAMRLQDAFSVCSDITSSGLVFTHQQQSYISNHIVACFLKIEAIEDRTCHLDAIMRMLTALLESDAGDSSSNDTPSDISIYLDLVHGLRSLDRFIKSSAAIQHEELLHRCISSLELRIPASRSRVSSLSSGCPSSASSSRAASPTPHSDRGVPSLASEVSRATRNTPVSEFKQLNTSDEPMHRIPIGPVFSDATEQAQLDASSVIAPAAPPPYIFAPYGTLQPIAASILSREIAEICEEYTIAEADRSIRVDVVSEIDRIVCKWNPSFKIAVYGSFATGLCDKDSDVDLLVTTPAALAYMQSHSVYEPTTLPPPPLPPVMLDELFILFQSDSALKKRHDRPPRCVSFHLLTVSILMHFPAAISSPVSLSLSCVSKPLPPLAAALQSSSTLTSAARCCRPSHCILES
jgi:hypothetical protein